MCCDDIFAFSLQQIFCAKWCYRKIYFKFSTCKRKKYLSEDYKGRNFLFSVAFGTDRKGLVDTILYNRNIMGLNELLDFERLKYNLTKENTALINHKNKFFVAYVYLSRGFDEPITNGEILMSSWINLNNGFSKAQGNRNLVLLSPILMIYGGKTSLKYESGYEEKKSGSYSSLTNSDNDALHAVPSNDTKGYIHNHVDDYETGEYNEAGAPKMNKPIKMFSPADVNTLMNLVDQNRNSGNFSDYYVSMVTNGHGHYMIKFSGTANDIKTGFGGDDWKNKYRDFMEHKGNLEKAFLQFLKNEMGVTGVELFKIKNNRNVKSLELKPNGKSIEEKDC